MVLNNFLAKLDTIDPRPSEAIVLYFNFDNIESDELLALNEITKMKFPNNTVICVPNKVNLEMWTKDTLKIYVSMINEMIEEL